MQSSNTLTILALTCLIITILYVTTVRAFNIEVDLIGLTINVIDGDTFDIKVVNGTEYRVRLADINASELGQVGYAEAKEYLRTLIDDKTVRLDVDDVYVWDARGSGNRLVCVSYVEYNSTHLMNVNEALVQAGYVKIKNYDNEFNPYIWSLYVSKSDDAIPTFPLIAIHNSLETIMIVLILALIVFIALYARGMRKYHHFRKLNYLFS